MSVGPDESSERLGNLLASLALGLVDDGTAALERVTGLSASGAAALLALAEFLGGANVGALADVLGLTHSGAVRLVAQLEAAGLVRRTHLQDRRQVNVELSAKGRRLATRAAEARMQVVLKAMGGLGDRDRRTLERLVGKLVGACVTERLARRREEGEGGAWWCRMCDFAACGRPDGRCPAAQRAAHP